LNNDRYVWKNLYGAPSGATVSEFKKLMNENPEFASAWRGRVLFHVEVSECDKPLLKVVSMDQEAIEEAQRLKKKDYAIIAQVGQAVALPDT